MAECVRREVRHLCKGARPRVLSLQARRFNVALFVAAGKIHGPAIVPLRISRTD